MEADDPQGVADLNPRDIVGKPFGRTPLDIVIY